MSIDHTRLTKLFLEDNFIISDHARVRMFQRNVSTEDIGQVILYGEMIEEYTDDEPCPSALFLGCVGGTPYHVVLAQCKDHVRVVTVYRPEKDKWIDYRIRSD
jgi:hypothetical protein